MAEPPECGARLKAQAEFQCLECGRHVEECETAWFSGRKICSECYHQRYERRCARCFRKLEGWQGRVFFRWMRVLRALLPAFERALRK